MTVSHRQHLLDPGGIQRLAPDHLLHACHPVNGGTGPEFACDALLVPLHAAFPMGTAYTDIAISGSFAGGDWTASSGHWLGRWEAPLFDIPATGRVAHCRFGCFQRWADGLVAETILLLDLPALMMQAGAWPLASPLGPLWPARGPHTRDGVNPGGSEGPASLAAVESMIAALMRYDGENLASMAMVDHWTPDFWWHGPAPIGSFQGHADYERGHQRPFLAAFPDRIGGNHRARIGEGRYVASTGWPSIRATHSGGDWLGLAPTDKRIEMRVMDFWRDSDAGLAENWVMIDIPHLLAQLGVDIFARMRALL